MIVFFSNMYVLFIFFFFIMGLFIVFIKMVVMMKVLVWWYCIIYYYNWLFKCKCKRIVFCLNLCIFFVLFVIDFKIILNYFFLFFLSYMYIDI